MVDPERSREAPRSGTRRARRYVFGALSVVVAVGVVAARPDVRRYVTYRFETKSGVPPVIESDIEAPLSDAAPPVRLAVAGDVGTGAAEERRTAAAMDDLEGRVEYDALLLLGDNVYPDGDPTKVQQTVLDPFADVLDGPTRLLSVLGNHDVRNHNGDAQATALGMPGRWYATTIGDTLIVSLDSTRPDDLAQQAWLTETLASSDATWKIAMMHHPPYSGGYHGSSIDVRQAFAPAFERYGVQLVLAGHDHDYQRSEQINGVTYVVSGAAAEIRETHRAGFSMAAWATYHFVDIGIWPERLELRAVDQHGDVFDEVMIARPPPDAGG